MFGVTTEN